MRKLTALMHVSLDGMAAGPNREMEWIKLSDELFDFVGTLTDKADGAIYGGITWELMDDYWPNAADKPDATKHDREHSVWYNNVEKLVVSDSMAGEEREKTVFTGKPIEDIKKMKSEIGKNILLLGSPSIMRFLTEHKMIDEYMLFVNPVLVGKGISVYPDTQNTPELELIDTKGFPKGVTLLHYKRTTN